MLEFSCGHYCGSGGCVTPWETPWLCFCHHYGHSMPLKLTQADRWSALQGWTGTLWLTQDGRKRDSPQKAPVSSPSWDSMKFPSCMKPWADFGLGRVHIHVRVTFTEKHRQSGLYFNLLHTLSVRIFSVVTENQTIPNVKLIVLHAPIT